MINYTREGISRRLISADTRKLQLRNRFIRSFFSTIYTLILTLIALLYFLTVNWIINFEKTIDYSVLNNFKFYGERVTMYDASNNLVKVFYENKDTTYKPIETLRQDYVSYLLAIEDKRFYEHNGIDLKGIFRATTVNIKSSSLSQGASTITQQLVRSQVLTTQKKITRKLTEVFLSLKLEQKATKHQILEQYLNTVYLGYGNYGIESACRFYYGKSFNELSLSQLCSIIPIIQSPNKFNPINNIELNNTKREIVLKSLLSQNLITEQEYTLALDDTSYLDIKMSRNMFNDIVEEINPYYLEQAYEQVILDLQIKNKCTRKEAIEFLESNGCKIYTYYDQNVERILQDIALNRKYAIDNEIQTAVVILDNKGIVKGILGGYDEKPSNYALNRAVQAKRQPGSTFKPIICYTPSMEYLSYTPKTLLNDTKKSYNTLTGMYTPSNYDGVYLGHIPLHRAISKSVNSTAVDTLHTVGIDRAYQFAESIGISTLVENRKGYTDKVLSSALGGLTDGVTPIDMAVAYNTIKTTTKYTPKFYSHVTDSKGEVIIDTSSFIRYSPNKVISETTSAYMTDCLIGVVQEGTGIRLRDNNLLIAGKTGTTTDSKDLWFVGYTPSYTLAVWYGYDIPKSINTGYLHLDIVKEVLYNLDTIYPDYKALKFITTIPDDEYENIVHKQYFIQHH